MVAVLICPHNRKDRLVFDTEQRGLGVRVDAAGRRTFLFQYSHAGQKRRLPLGLFGEITTAQARRLVQKHRGAVASGVDPWAEVKAAIEAGKAARATARKKAALAIYTVGALLEDWERDHLSHKRASYRVEAASRLRQHLAKLLPLSAEAIRRAEAARTIDDVAKNASPVSARRVHAYARAMFGWAQKRGTLEANPFQGIPAPGRETPRERVLSTDEVRLIWRAAAALPYPAGPMVQLQLLTLARGDEVAGMTWDEVADNLSLWTQPAGWTKNHRGHVIHLSAPARGVLSFLPRGSPGALIFTTFEGKPLSAFSFTKRQVMKRVEAERAASAKAAGQPPPPPLPNWRMHDFRRAGVTWLAENGFPPHVADRLLNHVQGTIHGVATVCQRGQFMEERRRALEAWAEHVVGAGERLPTL
jgi:site-specific recombinase XerD